MIVNDLKRKRQRDYTFDWNAAFDVSDLYIVEKLSNVTEILVSFLIFFCKTSSKETLV